MEKSKKTTAKKSAKQALAYTPGSVEKQSSEVEKNTKTDPIDADKTPQLDKRVLIRERIESLKKNCEKIKQEIKRKEKECSILKTKSENDEKSIRSSIEKFEREIEQKQKEKAHIGQDNKNTAENESSLTVFNQKSHKRNATESFFAIPESLEPLPKAGILYEGKGATYLEIAFWEEYQTGMEECKRFNAQLCAQKGITSATIIK